MRVAAPGRLLARVLQSGGQYDAIALPHGTIGFDSLPEELDSVKGACRNTRPDPRT
jgi:hypothetical protein